MQCVVAALFLGNVNIARPASSSSETTSEMTSETRSTNSAHIVRGVYLLAALRNGRRPPQCGLEHASSGAAPDLDCSRQTVPSSTPLRALLAALALAAPEAREVPEVPEGPDIPEAPQARPQMPQTPQPSQHSGPPSRCCPGEPTCQHADDQDANGDNVSGVHARGHGTDANSGTPEERSESEAAPKAGSGKGMQ